MSFFTAQKLKKMKTCFREGDYSKAVIYADKIAPADIKTAYELNMMADVYMENNRLASAKRVYGEIFARNKSTRVCKQLIDLCLEIKNDKQAEKYLNELKQISFDDYEIYVYEYRIGKATGKSDEFLIECLEKVREADYIDIWAFELAKLYFKNHMEEECRKECKNVILWFPETSYAFKAKVLTDALDSGTSYESIISQVEDGIVTDEPVQEEDDLPVISIPDDDEYSNIEYPEVDPVREAEENKEEAEKSGAVIGDETKNIKAADSSSGTSEKAGKGKHRKHKDRKNTGAANDQAPAEGVKEESGKASADAKKEKDGAETPEKAETKPAEKAKAETAENAETKTAEKAEAKPAEKEEDKGETVKSVEEKMSEVVKNSAHNRKKKKKKGKGKNAAGSETENKNADAAREPGPNTLMTNALADEVMKALGRGETIYDPDEIDDDSESLLKMMTEDDG